MTNIFRDCDLVSWSLFLFYTKSVGATTGLDLGFCYNIGVEIKRSHVIFRASDKLRLATDSQLID